MLSTLRGLHELDYGGPHLDLSFIATLPYLQKVSFYSDRYTGPEDENNIRSNQENQEKFSALRSITYTGMNRRFYERFRQLRQLPEASKLSALMLKLFLFRPQSQHM